MMLFLIDVFLETPQVFKNGIDDLFQCFTISCLLKWNSTELWKQCNGSMWKTWSLVWSQIYGINSIIKYLSLCQMDYRGPGRVSGQKKHLYHAIIPSGIDLKITLSILMSLISLNITYDILWWNYYLMILSTWHQQEIDYSCEWICLWICTQFVRRSWLYHIFLQ